MNVFVFGFETVLSDCLWYIFLPEDAFGLRVIEMLFTKFLVTYAWV